MQVSKTLTNRCLVLRRVKEEAERKERQERQLKAEASRAKKKADELKKKVSLFANKAYALFLLVTGNLLMAT